jgi:hypothetical protein
MGDIINFPRIHKKYKIRATKQQIRKELYRLYLHKNVGNFQKSKILHIMRLHPIFLKGFSVHEISTAFDKIILNSKMESFPSLRELIDIVEQERKTVYRTKKR